ncbi:MAG: SAM-dependent methyltransferase [Actinomycetes bacterium]
MRPWRQAWKHALYGTDGFFVREAPRDHFRTSVTASPLLAVALRRLAGAVDDALGRPDPFDVVDLGGGRAELLQALPDVPARWRLTAVERAPDPGVGVRWLHDLPRVTGLLLAHEWLDDVPLDVVDDGRLVLVDRDGAEALGPPASAEAAAWTRRWWPDGGRVEVGLARDVAWARAVGAVERGVALAVDYGHVLRPSGSTPASHAGPDATRFGGRRTTLTGYRSGRQVRPVPDGSCDVTAHVALDSCAAATGARLLDQRTALRALGVDGVLSPRTAPDYRQRLQEASQAGTLLDPAGPGGFGWLVRAVRTADPLADLRPVPVDTPVATGTARRSRREAGVA